MEIVDGGAKNTEERPDDKRIEKSTEQVTQRYVVTAYCHCEKCCGKSDGITASGVRATEGVTIASDLPFGTKVIVDGNTYIVQDRGGAIKGNRLDIYFNTHEKALQYGRQIKDVIILKRGVKNATA